jgi:hypothetical protein
MLADNVLALGEEADFEALNCLQALNLIRSTKLHLSTEPAFLPNACSSDTSGERYPTIYSDYVFHLLFNCKNRIKNERWK